MRAFFFAFVPIVLTLLLCFIVVQKAVEVRIKDRLRASLHETETRISRQDAEHSQQILRTLYTLTENPSLKAGIALLQENRDPRVQEQVQETLERQLSEMGKSLGFDLMLLENSSNQPLVGTAGPQRSSLDLKTAAAEFLARGLLRVNGKLYEVATVPINLGNENLGTLIVGKEFDLQRWTDYGGAALIRNGRILLTTFPANSIGEAEKQLSTRCTSTTAECEIEVRGETFLAMPVRQEMLGRDVQLLSFRSIDSTTRAFSESLAGLFPLIGGGGVLLVFLFSAVGAHSISKPLVNLIAQLRREGSAGGYSARLDADYRASEVNELAREFKRAAGAVRESARRLDEATEEFIESMAQAQDARDPYTAGHSERVSVNSTAIARMMGLPSEHVELIRIGARLHDIGKIGIPDAVLRKPGKLTRDEYTLIQRHPTIGREILEKVGRFREFLPYVELHHENPDGSGYPYGLRNDEIPLGVRIVHVADVYDAITSDRAYRKAMALADAWELLRKGTGTLFDPDVVEALWAILRTDDFQDSTASLITPHDNDFAFYPLSSKDSDGAVNVWAKS
jgi:putative nucleotidyltransferase with HDIG domain